MACLDFINIIISSLINEVKHLGKIIMREKNT